MNERIRELAKQSGGEFWQRIESNGVLNKEAYITFDPPKSLDKFVELVVRECIDIAQDRANFPGFPPNDVNDIIDEIREHFGVEE